MVESGLQYKILKMLNAHKWIKAVNFHASAFTEKGTPDILGTCRGRAFALEVKVEGRKPTPKQIHELGQWESAGAFVMVAREDFRIKDLLNGIEKV